MHRSRILLAVTLLTWTLRAEAEPLPNTKPLDWDGDLASRMVDGIDRFLLEQIQASVGKREESWQRDVSSEAAFNRSLEPNRKRLAHLLGIRDPRVRFDAPELVATTETSARIAEGKTYDIFAIRWPVLADPDPNRENVVVHGEGLLLVPRDTPAVADIVAIPDADQTPEQLCGLTDGVPRNLQFARRLAESGCRVIVPTLISREMQRRSVPGRGPGANLTNREYHLPIGLRTRPARDRLRSAEGLWPWWTGWSPIGATPRIHRMACTASA